jgi:hypothetical protein
MAAESTTPLERFVFNQLPYLGSPFNRRENDPEEMQPTLSYKAHVRIFNLSIEEDLKEYTDIWNRVCKQEIIIGIEERQYDPVEKTWRIFLRWSEQFYTDPIGVKHV